MRSKAFKFKPVLVSLTALVPSIALSANLIFQDDFDSHPEWTSAMEDQHTPEGWSDVRNQPKWAPSTGHADRHEGIELLSRNVDKARGGIGKSFVSWRDAYSTWSSDNVLLKQLDKGYDQLYISFWVTFEEDWTEGGQSKLFRAFSWDETSESYYNFFEDGNAGPIFLWDYNSNSYGLRNFLAFRGGPHGDNYTFNNDQMPNTTRRPNGLGDFSYNFTSDLVGSTLGEDPQLVDQVNGGFISKDPSSIVSHQQIYGNETHWTKVAFYLEMNSSPGENDGVFMQWFDDELIIENRNVRWVGENSENKMVKWNIVAIGGNDYFTSYPESERVEEWYAIDDFKVYDGIPNQPNPPSNFVRQ